MKLPRLTFWRGVLYIVLAVLLVVAVSMVIFGTGEGYQLPADEVFTTP